MQARPRPARAIPLASNKQTGHPLRVACLFVRYGEEHPAGSTTERPGNVQLDVDRFMVDGPEAVADGWLDRGGNASRPHSRRRHLRPLFFGALLLPAQFFN